MEEERNCSVRRVGYEWLTSNYRFINYEKVSAMGGGLTPQKSFSNSVSTGVCIINTRVFELLRDFIGDLLAQL